MACFIDEHLDIFLYILLQLYLLPSYILWMFDYLEKEIGVHIIRDPITIQLNDKTLMIGHGDGLGPGDLKYKFIKKFTLRC